MLPSSGYFRGIPCPGHIQGTCNRPYCHFRHDVKVCAEKNVSSASSSTSHTAVPTPVQEETDAEEEGKQEELEHQNTAKELTECSSASLTPATTIPSEPVKQQPQPHTSQQQEPVTAPAEVPKSELLQQLMSEALKKVLAENPTLASTVDASSIRIGIDPITQGSPEVNKSKKQLYHRPPDTPSYNPTPIRELKKRKQSVDGVHSLVYNPTGKAHTNVREGTESGDDEGGPIGEFSSDESEETEEKNDDFDLLEEVLAEHSKNSKVKVKKKKVKELGKLQYSLNNAHKESVDNNIMITDAKKLTDKEVKKYEVSQTESVNKVITDGPYFLPPSPIFTSSSDGFEAFNSKVSHQEEENSMLEKCSEKPPPHISEAVKTNNQPAAEKKTTPKPTPELPKSSSQQDNEKKVTKASGHALLPQLISAMDAPKLARPNVRTWTPLVRNNIPLSETQKNNDQLDEILQLMDGNDPSSKRKLKESEHQTSSQRDSQNARPKKKYKVDLNKEIESLTNPALELNKEAVTADEDSTNQQPESSDNQESDKKQSTKAEISSEESLLHPKEKEAKKKSTKDSEDQEQTDGSDEKTEESEDSNNDTLDEESDDDSDYRRARHRKKRKRKRSRSSSSGSDYSHHRRKKRKRSHKRRHKRNKRSRKRRDSTSSLSDQSQESEEEKDEKKDDDDEEEEEDTEEDEEEEEEKSKDDSESGDKGEDSDDDIEHIRKSKRHKKKHKHYKKLKHKRNKHKARRKRKRSKSYSRSRDSSRSSSRSRTRSRSSSKHRKKRNRSRHKSKNYSDNEKRDSAKETSRSRSSSSSSSKHRKSRESREDDSSGSKYIESSKSKDKRVDEEDSISRKEDRKRRDRSTSKSEQTSDEKKNKNQNDEEISIPMPVDPSKIKVEKNALVPDLSKVKIEKEDPMPEKSNGQGQVNAKESAQLKENSGKGQSESGQNKVPEKIHEQRRPSTEDKSRRSHERKGSTESTSDKTLHRRQSCESKASDNEGSLQRKKTEERRSSTEKNKKSLPISSQPSEMSMFDLVLASAEISKPKTLTEISIFDSVAKASTNHSQEASEEKVAHHDAKSKNRDVHHKSGGGNAVKSSAAVSSEHKSSSSDKTSKSSRSEKTVHTDSHHKLNKSDSKSSCSSSKSKSSSSSSHHSSSSSSHKRTSSTSSRGSTRKHHSTSTTTITTATSTTTTSSSSKTSDTSSSSSSKSKKLSDPTSSKSEKESSRHSSTLSRKHSNSSNRHHDSSSRRRSSSSSSKHKEGKESTAETAKSNERSETSKKRRISAGEDSHDCASDDDHLSNGGDSPLPDLSVLDEISQDDWEQMISGMDAMPNQETLEETDSDDVDHDNPWVMEECMKVFSEFQPDANHLENQVLPKKIKITSEDTEPPKASSKQRVARSSTTGNLVKKPSTSRHQKTSPMQMMVERYQKLKEQLKLKEKQLHHLKGGPSAGSSSSSKPSITAASSSKPSITAASSTTHHNTVPQPSAGKSKKRIAHVPNVNSLLNAQEKITKQTPPSSISRISPKVAKASGVIPETTAHTVAKGGKRIAHTPKAGALARPIIQPELGSLVPQNIRQRYLNALIDECQKFSSEREAFNIAAAEERVCYKRARSRMVYLNLVVNAVKRLRTLKHAGLEAQELLDQDPQLAEKMCIEEPSASSTKPSPTSSPSSSRPHPINPNHVQLSHTSVLTAGGIRGSWSIEKPKKTSGSSEEALRGEAFYKNLSKYVLNEEQLEENGYPCPDPEEKGKAIVKKIDSRKKISPSALERYCDRCSVLYTVDKWGFPKSSSPCVYHWGRPYKKRKYGTFEASYSCCGGEQGSGGCSQATTHVSDNYNPKNLRGYVRTISKDTSSSNKEVYALDCEMCYTTEGNELTRVTVIGSNGDVVYEQLVKPENPILDYNTRFSGITENDMEDVKITIRDVQAALLARFSDKTILIGHSLESDLHALKIIHTTVVDTSVVFPHKMGPPYKRALRNLAAEYLKRIIQDDVSGHDSAEDAVACLHLMQWKVKEDLKGFSK